MARDHRDIMRSLSQEYVVKDDNLKDRISQTISELRQLKQDCLEVGLEVEKMSKAYRSERVNGEVTLPESSVPLERFTNEEHVEAVKRIHQSRESRREAIAPPQAQFISEVIEAPVDNRSLGAVREIEAPITENLFESFTAGSLRKFKGFRKIEDIQAEEKEEAERAQAYKDHLNKVEEEDIVSLHRKVDTRFEIED